MATSSGTRGQDEISRTAGETDFKQDRALERCQSAVIPDSQTAQIRMRSFLVSSDHRQPEQAVIDRRHPTFTWSSSTLKNAQSVFVPTPQG